MQRLLILLFLSVPALAQQAKRPYFRGNIGFSGGQYSFRTDDRSLDDNADAGLLQIEFEATSRHGIGGGIRFEGLASDDDLFVQNGAAANQAASTTLFAHFTYRIEEHRFRLPMRVGVLFNGLVLEEDLTALQATYASIGPYFEVEPELTLVRRGGFRWSIYGQLGVGAAATAIDFDGDSRDYDSSTGFVGIEAGTRLTAGHFEFGIGYLGRFQSMDESDPEGGTVALGYDGDFNGLLMTFGVVF